MTAPEPVPVEFGTFAAARQAFIDQWRLLLPHLTPAEAQAEAEATFAAMIQLTLLIGAL